MKKLLASSTVGILGLVIALGCSNQNESSKVKGGIIEQAPKTWNILVKENEDVLRCSHAVAKTGAKIKNVLTTIGAITVDADSSKIPLIEALSCVQLVEEDGEMKLMPPVLTTWIIAVKDGQNIETCSTAITNTGATVTTKLETIGIIVAETFSSDSKSIEALPCVLSVELEQVMNGGGISGVSNH